MSERKSSTKNGELDPDISVPVYEVEIVAARRVKLVVLPVIFAATLAHRLFQPVDVHVHD